MSALGYGLALIYSTRKPLGSFNPGFLPDLALYGTKVLVNYDAFLYSLSKKTVLWTHISTEGAKYFLFIASILNATLNFI